MVDFQQRDTRRGPLHDDDGDESAEDDAETDEPRDEADEGHDDAERGDDHDHDHEQEHDHDHHAHDLDTLGTAVVTISSSRSLSDDPAGDAIVEIMEADGNEVVTRELVQDEHDNVQSTVDTLANRGDVDVVVTTGGTGVTPDDVTIEAVTPLFDKELPGFGELFRMLSYDEISTRIVATRATAGVIDGVPVFCLPGSENAVRIGTRGIVVEEAGHLAGLARR